MNIKINQIQVIKKILKTYLLFYFFIFVSLTTIKSYSLYTQSILITSNIRNNILIDDRRSVEQEINNSLKNDFIKIVIYNNNKSIYIEGNLDQHPPSPLFHFAQSVNSNDSGASNDFYILYYFSIWNILLTSLEIVLYLSVFLVPMYFYEKRKLTLKLTEKLDREKLEYISGLALKVSHDIRSPIAALNSILQNSKVDDETKKVISLALQRINSVSNDLLRDESRVTLGPEVEIIQLLKNQLSLKKFEYKLENHISLSVPHNIEKIFINVNPIEIESIVSNLLNNSIEVTKNIKNQQVAISTLHDNDSFKIIIEDNGPGFNENILEKLGKDRFTTKQISCVSGSGLALFNARNYLNSIGCRIKFENNLPNGARITINFKQFIIKEKKLHILVDDDELTRINWEYKAKKNNIELKTFKNADDFKKSLESIDKNAIIYLDSELGVIKGEELALELNINGFKNLNITSGHAAGKFSHLVFLKSIIDKNPPF